MLGFRNYLFLIEKITDYFEGYDYLKKFLFSINREFRKTRKPIEEIWVKYGGRYDDNLLQKRVFILPGDYLYPIVIYFNNYWGDASTNFINNLICITLNINIPDLEFIEDLEHELNHISNLIIKRKQKDIEYNLLNRSGMKFVGSSNREEKYYSQEGEIDAFARQYTELYKIKYPNQKFDLNKLKILDSFDKEPLIFYINMFYDEENEEYKKIGKRFISKIAVEINGQFRDN